MTPKAQVDSIVALLTHRNAVAAGHIEVNNRMLKSLCEDAAALRELVDALPKCQAVDIVTGVAACLSPATRECGSHATGFWQFCDAHAPFQESYWDLPAAAVVRRIGP